MDTRKQKARNEIMACLGLICTSSSQPIRLVLNRDCIEGMRDLPDNSVHSVVCDPPYGLAFMGKEWDSFGGNLGFQEAMKAWAVEAIRVLKPGGHLLAFGGTKTYHRLACGLEDAGFEIRDCLMWLYGSGFPKSLDVSKAIDKQEGVGREVVGRRAGMGKPNNSMYATSIKNHDSERKNAESAFTYRSEYDVTAPSTEAARQWEGWGTALKPAWEPIIMARKPLSGTVARNVVEWGVGALNIDQCRVSLSSDEDPEKLSARSGGLPDRLNRSRFTYGAVRDLPAGWDCSKGRWPANVVLSHLSDCKQVGTRRAKAGTFKGSPERSKNLVYGEDNRPRLPSGYADADGKESVEAWACHEDCPILALDRQSGVTTSMGDASRFFYCAKPSRREREAGLEAFDPRYAGKWNGGGIGERRRQAGLEVRRNIHPTVKPRALMAYLLRLVTPEGGVVLDPFAGSGTTGCAAAVVAGTRFIGFELSREYTGIANARIAHSEANASVKPKADKPAKKKPAVVEPEPKPEKSDNLFRFTLGDPAKALKALGHKAKTSGK